VQPRLGVIELRADGSGVWTRELQHRASAVQKHPAHGVHGRPHRLGAPAPDDDPGGREARPRRLHEMRGHTVRDRDELDRTPLATPSQRRAMELAPEQMSVDRYVQHGSTVGNHVEDGFQRREVARVVVEADEHVLRPMCCCVTVRSALPRVADDQRDAVRAHRAERASIGVDRDDPSSGRADVARDGRPSLTETDHEVVSTREQPNAKALHAVPGERRQQGDQRNGQRDHAEMAGEVELPRRLGRPVVLETEELQRAVQRVGDAELVDRQEVPPEPEHDGGRTEQQRRGEGEAPAGGHRRAQLVTAETADRR
jgi:hypothetical protein